MATPDGSAPNSVIEEPDSPGFESFRIAIIWNVRGNFRFPGGRPFLGF